VDIDYQALLQAFHGDAQENLAALEAALLALENSPSGGDLIDEAFRRTHSIKGDASCVGFDDIMELAHGLEGLLERLRSRPEGAESGTITLMLRAVDALRALVAHRASGAEQIATERSALLDELEVAAAAGEETTGTVAAGSATEAASMLDEGGGTLRVGVEKLDRMLNLIGEVLISRGRTRRMIEQLSGAEGVAVREAESEDDRLYVELQELIMKARMVPLGPLFRRHIRTVRDLTSSCDKVARLAIEGGDVEVDTAVVQQLRDPITHLVRNAVDHGLESPARREEAGKDPCGAITLSARHDAGTIVVEVTDDGAGLARDRVEARARASGLVAEPESLADDELFQLVFESGFSTAPEVTELSGRGVGLDVVRKHVQALRGSVSISSAAGLGCTVTLRVPLTLAIIDSFEVGAGGETYVFPLDSVSECVDLPSGVIGATNGRGVMDLRGRPLPCVRLNSLFGRVAPPSQRESVVVVRCDDAEVGFAVDELLGEAQRVIKPLGFLFDRVRGVSGATILGSGRVALIIDVPELIDAVVPRETAEVMATT
jgi:two-component system chemotaxis sensor kinase CheA